MHFLKITVESARRMYGAKPEFWINWYKYHRHQQNKNKDWYYKEFWRDISDFGG
jgi:hypothetical protein